MKQQTIKESQNEFYISQSETAIRLMPGVELGYRQDAVYRIINEAFGILEKRETRLRSKAVLPWMSMVEHDVLDSSGRTSLRIRFSEYAPGKGKFFSVTFMLMGTGGPLEFWLGEDLSPGSSFGGTDSDGDDEVFSSHTCAYEVIKALANLI